MRAMEQLDKTHGGAIAACYVTWLSLRNVPPCPESSRHWDDMRARLAHLVNGK